MPTEDKITAASVICLAVVVGIAAIAGMYFCWRIHLRKERQPDNPQRPPNSETGRSPNDPAAAAAVIHTESQPTPAIGDKESARNQKGACFKCILEVLGIVGLLAYAYLTAMEWGEMHRQTAATQTAAGAAKSAADTASAQLVLSQRPWVGPDGTGEIRLTSIPGGIQSDAWIEIKNFGPSPAFHVEQLVGQYGVGGGDVTHGQSATGLKSDFCRTTELPILNADKGQEVPEYGFPLYPQAPSRSKAPRLAGPIPLDEHVEIIGCFAYVDQLHASEVRSPIHHSWFCYMTMDPLNKLVADLADKVDGKPKYPDGKVVPVMNCSYFQGAD